MFAQELSPDFEVPGRREPGELPELVAEVGLVEVARGTGEVAPVDRSGGVDRLPLTRQITLKGTMMKNNVNPIVVLHDDLGYTYQEIAEVVGLHPLTVAKKILWATEPKSSRRPTPKRVKRDRDRGMAYARIAARYDINKKAVKRYLAAAA